MPSWTVSVRDYDKLKHALENGEKFQYPEECRHNSNVIREILKYAPKILPTFGGLSENEIGSISDIVSYVMRPDLVINGFGLVGPQPLRKAMPAQSEKAYTTSIKLAGDPNKITPDFEKEDDPGFRTAELFRCYCCVLDCMPQLYDKLIPGESHLGPAFRLADLTGYLLSPEDLTDYSYTEGEIENFNKVLGGEVRSEFGS